MGKDLEGQFLLRCLYENSPYGIVMCRLIKDENGKAIDFIHLQGNNAVEVQTGYDLKDIVGKKASEVASPQELAGPIKLYERVVSTGKPASYDQYFPVYGRTLEVTAFPLQEDMFVINFSDISEHKRVEEELAKHHDHLEKLVEQRTAKLQKEVSERKKAQGAMREGESKLDTVLNTVQTAVVVHDHAGRIILSNPAAEKMLGVQDATIGEKQSDDPDWVFLKEDGTTFSAEELPVNQVLGTQKPVIDLAMGVICPGRHEIAWLLSSAVPIIDAQGGVSHVVVSSVDITDRKKAEDELQESEKQYDNLFNRMSEGCALCEIILDKNQDPVDYRFLKINPAFGTHTGMSAKNSLGKTIKEIYPDIEDFWIKTYGNVAITQEPMQVQDYNHNTNRWYDVAAFSPSKGRFAMFFRDITESKKAEDAIRESEERLRTLIVNIPGASYRCAVDEGWTMEYISDEIENISGYPATDFLNNAVRSFASIVHPGDRQIVDPISLEAIENKETFTIEYRIIASDGSNRWVHERGQGVFNEEGKVVHLDGVILDITDRKKAEKELEQHRQHLEELVEERSEQLIQSERLAATGRLAASVAHEINNPLQGMTSHLDLMKDGLPKDSNKFKNYDYVKSNIRRISGIVGQLLDIYRESKEEKSTVDINELINEVVHLIDNKRRMKGVSLKLESKKQLPGILGWRQQLHQVILNLLLNALDNTAEAGEVVVTTSCDDNILEIQIKDNGRGIKKEDIGHIFDPFFSTKKEDGVGLGLFVCQGLIKNHEGEINVKSQDGKGSNFTITLPRR